jgi:hypothetical protein
MNIGRVSVLILLILAVGMSGNLNATQGSFSNLGDARGRVLPAPIANWKVLFALSPLTVAGVPNSGLATDSPAFGTPSSTSNPMDGVGVAGRFGTPTAPESVTLEVGQTLTVSAMVKFTGGLASGVSSYRFAVLNDAGRFVVPSIDDWGGGWLHVVNTGSVSGELWRANTVGNYMSISTSLPNNPVDLNASKAYSGGIFSANSATSYLWTMTITRDSETTVDLVSSVVGGPNNYSETYTASNIATSLFTYNAVGMQTTASGDLDQLSISTAQYSVTGSNVSPGSPGPRVLGIDFNRDDVVGSPSQSLFRVVSGSATNQTANASSYAKTFGARQLTISQPDAAKFEFRGANGDSTRSIPGGDISLSYLVADFIATRRGAMDLTITGLPAGNYLFRSYHLDTFTGSGFGFAQGTATTTPNTIQAKIGGTVKASVQPTVLGPSGLNTTFINNNQIPALSFGFSHNGAGPLTIELRATQANGSDSYLLLNGFELFQANP